MQEVMKDGSEGKVIVEDTLEDLLPHIKKSLENPDVKFVKVFRGAKLLREEKKVVAVEEKKDLLDSLKEEIEK